MKNKRRIIQIIATALSNAYVIGFFKGKIYTGNTKIICVPGLNCYSCPGALGACPIGALQAVLGGRNRNFSYYIVGIMIFFGVFFGRFVCGFLCPFGLIQDLLYKIPSPKLRMNPRIDKPLRWFKYVIGLIFVILLPIFLTNNFGMGDPYFCKLICPVGTLEGGIPLILTNESLKNAIGFLFNWKMSILIVVILSSIFIYRPFCKYLCPLGAFYSLFNKVSFYKMNLNKEKCIDCKACERACKMQVKVTEEINSLECIRCGDCQKVCPVSAITMGFEFQKSLQEKEEIVKNKNI